MIFRQFINPHAHSDGSLDGASTVKDIVQRAVELNSPYLTLTEHGNMNTAMDLYKRSRKADIKPILGIELYLRPPFMEALQVKWETHFADDPKREVKVAAKLRNEYVHLTVHFKDEWAYLYFCKLSPIMDARAVTHFGERKPICTIEELRGAAGHITIGSGCIVGLVQKWLLPDRLTGELRPTWAEAAYVMAREIAGEGNFIVEVFPHRLTHNWKRPVKDKTSGRIVSEGQFIPIEKTSWFPEGDLQLTTNRFMIALAEKYGDPIVISLDSHFATPNQKLTQDAKLGNGQEAWRFHTSYHMQSTEESAIVLKETLGVTDETIEQWVNNSYKWAANFDNFKIATCNDRWVLLPLPDNWMIELKRKIDRHGRMDWSKKEMVDRFKTELDILAFNGTINLMSYFFVVEDVANYCRENGLLMSVRGSAGGSLIVYLLGIGAFNPLKHNLSFERFLTLGRINANTLPDIDVDGSREKILEYLDRTYGECMCQLSTDTMLRLKSSIKDAERALTGAVSAKTETMCKKLPFSPQGADERDQVFGHFDSSGVYHQGLIETNEYLKEWARETPVIWDTVKSMVGVTRNKSVHACGLVIADKPVQEYCPVITVSKTRATAFSPKSVEEAGLIKFDFLGVTTMGDVEECLKSIKDRLGIQIDPWNLPEDPDVYEQFANGETETVFQFATETVIPFLKEIKPKNIDELAAVTALCRPGTLDAPYGDGRTLAQVFVDRCNGEPIEYIHPDLEPIFKETKGIQLYQEQTISIFKIIAGYSDEKAEVVRRGIGKKIKEVLESCMLDLKTACLSKGWKESQVNLLIDQIMASSNYSFNKSHATSYAYLARACAYLKKRYPLDWWKACMSNAKKDKVSNSFWKHVKDFTLLPDINKSGNEFLIEGDCLRSPVSMINGIGPAAYKQLTDNSPYSDLRHFLECHSTQRTSGEGRSSVHSGIIRKLIAAGVMDSFFEKDLMPHQKISEFEYLYAEIRKEKPKPVPEEYAYMKPLGMYLLKKELIKVYSEDLRPIMMPPRGGAPSSINPTDWEIGGFVVTSAEMIFRYKEASAKKVGEECEVACLGYVLEEKLISYKNKTKQATKMTVDVGGTFFEDVLWPARGTETSPSGFKGFPVMMIYRFTNNWASLIKVVPLLHKDQLSNYNVL